MPCNTLIDPVCRALGHAVHSFTGTVTGGVLDGLAQAVDAGLRWVVVNTATWWLNIPSPNLTGEPAVASIQRWLLPITAAVAVGGMIAAGVRMALARRANPLLDVTGGLLTLAAATTFGVALAALLIKAGDAWSAWVLQVSTGGHFAQRLEMVLQFSGGPAAAVVVVFGIIAIVVALVQAILMLFRQAALVILAGTLPLAAAGSIAPMTRSWVRRVGAWMLALICYKPAAAAVYAAGFTMIGTGHDPRVALMGFVMLLLSVLTLPALMRFFTWTVGGIGAPGGGGGQLLGAATMAAVAVGAMRSGAGESGAHDQAAYLDSRLGLATGGGASTPGGPPPNGPSGIGGGAGPGGSSSAGTSADGGSPAGTAASGRPEPSASASTGATRPDSGAAPSGAADAPVSGMADAPAAPSGSAAGGANASAGSAGTGPAAAGAAGAGPAGVVAAEAARAAAQGGRLATGAMNDGDQQ